MVPPTGEDLITSNASGCEFVTSGRSVAIGCAVSGQSSPPSATRGRERVKAATSAAATERPLPDKACADDHAAPAQRGRASRVFDPHLRSVGQHAAQPVSGPTLVGGVTRASETVQASLYPDKARCSQHRL
jgi:hypothetical protein